MTDYETQLANALAFCRANLKRGIDPERYAAAMVEELPDDDDHVEIRALHSRTGSPVTARLNERPAGLPASVKQLARDRTNYFSTNG